MDLKNAIRSTLNYLHLDLTKNLEYDRLTKSIMKRVISPNSNCVDVGCHKGEILDIILDLSPKGKHFAFEPLPHMFHDLESKYSSIVSVYPYALSNKKGSSKFQYIKNAPAYSGIKKRKYDIGNPDIQEISVELRRLDDILLLETKIDFIKIDVEGAELGVLQGAIDILKKSKPIVVFEFGKGASDYYGTTPAEMFSLFVDDVGMKISTLKAYIKNSDSLSLSEFDKCFETNSEYYFIAHN